MPGKILIVDSAASNRIVLKVKLSGAFYQMEQATDGREALALMGDSSPDLVLLSDRPGDPGLLALCSRIKSDPRYSQLPVLVVGGASSLRARLAALKAGADDVLDTPVDDQFLLARIRSLLRNYDTLEEMRMNGATARMLGFAETSPTFSECASVVIAAGTRQESVQHIASLKPLVPFVFRPRSIGETIRTLAQRGTPDAVVILCPDDQAEDSLRLLAELRAHKRARRGAILVISKRPADGFPGDALDLGADDVMRGGFDPEEVAVRLSRLVQRKRYVDRLRRDLDRGLNAAVVDPLTGLFNRRYAIPKLAQLADHTRNNCCDDIAVMIADLDHFKRVNDQFGHAAGDEVLVEVARRLRGSLGPRDLVARLGGEEFLIALPASDVARASAVARRLCQRIGGHPVGIGHAGQTISVTVSIGIAMGSDVLGRGTMDDGNAVASAILECADKALYGAKSHGRNRVILSRPAA